MKRFSPSGLLILIVSVLWIGNADSHIPRTPSGAYYPQQNVSRDIAYPVLKVVDGDTIKIDYKGKSETVRLIGVDTPETVHPNKPVEFFGKEASAFLKNLLKGESVYLRFGDEERGKYGRLLAYVYRAPDGLFVNLEIVRQGYGHAYVKFPFKHMEIFREYEKRARVVGKGLWTAQSPQPTSRETKSQNPATKAVSESVRQTDGDGDITVYVTKSGKKYHRGSCRWGDRPLSLAKAREIYSPCKKCNPPK